jgi:PAS domain S-box-containing protein
MQNLETWFESPFYSNSSLNADVLGFLAQHEATPNQLLTLLGLIIEHSSLLMCYVDTQFRYVLLSRSFAEMLGKTAAEMQGISMFQGRPDPELKLRPIMQKIIETGQAYSAKELALVNSASKSDPKELPTRFWNLNLLPVTDSTGSTVGILDIFEDVTATVLQRQHLEQIAAQERARAAELETILNNMSEGICVIDKAGRVVRSNPISDALMRQDLSGHTLYSPHEVDYNYNRRHIDGRPLEASETLSARVLRGEIVRDFRYIASDGEGRDHTFSTNGTPLYDEYNQISGGILLFHDVTATEQHQIELELANRSAEEIQKALLELAVAAAGVSNLPELLQNIVKIVPAVTGCDRAGITLYNSQTEELLPGAVYGLKPEQIPAWMSEIGKRDRSSPYDAMLFERHETLTLDFKVLAETFRQQGIELPNPYNIETALFLPLVYRGEFIGMLSLDHAGTHHIFTPHEIRILEGMARLSAIAIQNVRLLSQANEAFTLREANRLKDEFMSLVAHELRNPLTTVKGYTQMIQRQLRKTGTNEGQIKHLDLIVEQSDRMTRLVEDLLDLARIEAGRFELRLNSADLALLAARAIETYQSNTSKHVLTLTLDSGSDHTVYTGFYDVDRLSQVISNLLSNAIKYSPQGGVIALKLYRQSGADLSASIPSGIVDNLPSDLLHFSITDSGIGIPHDQQEALFERFFRSSLSRASGLPGLGLGLHISSQIITLHNGYMWAESSGENLGSTFHFFLPFVPVPELE